MISGQMILYFIKKSKIFGYLILSAIFLILSYLIFVLNVLLLMDFETVQIVKNPSKMTMSSVVVETSHVDKGAFVASSRGKYFYPISCSRARSLSVKNMLYFKDKVSAEAQGYLEYNGC